MAPSRSPAQPSPRSPASPRSKWLLPSLIALLLSVLIGALLAEARSSRWQSSHFSQMAADMHYQLASGPNPSMRWPQHGPFDQRFGYTRLSDMLQRLQDDGYRITAQARQSPAMQRFIDDGFFPPHAEKSRAGLTLRDCQQIPLYESLRPQRGFADYANIPMIAVRSLLFIENRELLDTTQPWLNPAVDWPRFSKAAWSQLQRRLDDQADSSGGSTLATQIEKYRHSPDGLTSSIREKYRQMISASVRAYSQGRETLPVRRQLVLDYLNTVPLAAAPGHGEVHGLLDALAAWFGADAAQSMQALNGGPQVSLEQQALALRQVVALLVAQRRPSWYLLQARDALEELTDQHLRLLARHSIISLPLRDAALAQRLQFRPRHASPPALEPALDKGVIQSRNRLVSQLGLPLYDLDRLDLQVRSTLNSWLQDRISRHLLSLADAKTAAQFGLTGRRLLQPSQTALVDYSFTLFEHGPDGNRVRVQTDTSSQLFNINEGSKMELGSTAKLRVMATYLEIIAELYRRHAGGDGYPLSDRSLTSNDNLSRWMQQWLQRRPNASLEQTLEAALDRRYSASTGEEFFTGGGIHTFANFRREDNGRNPTLRESLRQSINLPMVRLLRDLVQYSNHQAEDNYRQLLRNDRDPRRRDYLRRFADRDGTRFLAHFWRKYLDRQPDEMLDSLLEGLRPEAQRLAAIHRYLYPQASQEDFRQFMQQRLQRRTPSRQHLQKLYARFAPGSYSLSDQGWLARVHPLELWLAGYRLRQPDASFEQAVQTSSEQRIEVYDWLFKTPDRRARDSRLRSILEVEAFIDIHQRWSRLGYPFGHLIPSLASALGSSGDRPAALAELMGIILNDGRRLPTLHSEAFIFAAGTPWETRLAPAPSRGEQVMEPAVARTLRRLLNEVVERGTARRLSGSFSDIEGQPLLMGGKTGTGDNRSETVVGGRVIHSRVRNRTATFVFFLGPRHFGTLTAWVDGEAAEGMRFTSALPVQVLRSMAPLLQGYLNDPHACQIASGEAP